MPQQEQKAETLPMRVGEHWSSFERTTLLEQFGNGETIEQIANRHQRTRWAIRAQLIALGAVNPELGKERSSARRNRRTGRPLAYDEKRDRLPWTQREIEFLVDSRAERSADLHLLASMHRRRPLTILHRLYTVAFHARDASTSTEQDLRCQRLVDLERFIGTQHEGFLSVAEAEALASEAQRGADCVHEDPRDASRYAGSEDENPNRAADKGVGEAEGTGFDASSHYIVIVGIRTPFPNTDLAAICECNERGLRVHEVLGASAMGLRLPDDKRSFERGAEVQAVIESLLARPQA